MCTCILWQVNKWNWINYCIVLTYLTVGKKLHVARWRQVIIAGIILDMGSSNEKRRYIVTPSLIGWANTGNDPCVHSDMCSKTCLATVLIRSIFAQEKLHERFSASAVFLAQNRTNKHSSKRCFAFITHLVSTQTTKSWKMLMNNKFKAQSLNRKSYRKFALSCFSITCFKHVGLLWPIRESRSVVIAQTDAYAMTSYPQWKYKISKPLSTSNRTRVHMRGIFQWHQILHCVNNPLPRKVGLSWHKMIH